MGFVTRIYLSACEMGLDHGALDPGPMASSSGSVA